MVTAWLWSNSMFCDGITVVYLSCYFKVFLNCWIIIKYANPKCNCHSASRYFSTCIIFSSIIQSVVSHTRFVSDWELYLYKNAEILVKHKLWNAKNDLFDVAPNFLMSHHCGTEMTVLHSYFYRICLSAYLTRSKMNHKCCIFILIIVFGVSVLPLLIPRLSLVIAVCSRKRLQNKLLPVPPTSTPAIFIYFHTWKKKTQNNNI